MITPRLTVDLPLLVAGAVLVFAVSWSSMPDWFGMLRTVMIGVGGVVVVAIVLVVAVAIISGVMGMIGKLRKKS